MGFDYISMENYKKLKQLPDIIKEDPKEIYYNFRNLGTGNSSYVYCAEDRKNNRLIALKKFKLGHETCDEDLKEIINEINIIKTIKHENCVRYYGTFLTKDYKIYLSMEYCIGSVIDAITVLKTNLTENVISEILYSIIKALKYLHSLGYIHRDVKGANILINIDGIVKLSDFGSTSPFPLSSEFVGSSYWMAPELLLAMDAKDYDCSVDIWSFGITAIELVYKKPPYMEVNPMSAMYKIVQLPAPQIYAPEYSDNMTNLINSCLQKESTARPSASKLLEMIEKFYKYPSLDRLAVHDLIMKTNKIIGQKIKDFSSNLTTNTDRSPVSNELFGDEEDVEDIEDIKHELVELCNILEKKIQIEQGSSKDIEKNIKANHTLTSRVFTNAKNLMAIHLREVINAEDQNTNAEYNILQLKFRKIMDKENLKEIGKLVRSQQLVLKNLEKKNKEVFEDMILRTESSFREKMNKFEQEMNKLKVCQVEELEKYIKNACSTHPTKLRPFSLYNGDSFLGDEHKSQASKQNSSVYLLVPPNHRNHQENIPDKTEEIKIEDRQKMERDFLKEELDLLEKQLKETHSFLIKSHADLSSFQAKIMEEKQAIRVKQINEKHAIENAKYKKYNDYCLKNQANCHNSILNNFPKKIKAEVFKIEKERRDYIREYKIVQNSEFSKKNCQYKEENIKNSKKQHKVDVENHIKEYEKEIKAKIENLKREIMDSTISMIDNEKKTLSSNLTNNLKEMIKFQETYLENTKEKMINKRLKLSDGSIKRRKCVNEKMELDKKQLLVYTEYRIELLKHEHQEDLENLRKYLNLNIINIQSEF